MLHEQLGGVGLRGHHARSLEHVVPEGLLGVARSGRRGSGLLGGVRHGSQTCQVRLEHRGVRITGYRWLSLVSVKDAMKPRQQLHLVACAERARAEELFGLPAVGRPEPGVPVVAVGNHSDPGGPCGTDEVKLVALLGPDRPDVAVDLLVGGLVAAAACPGLVRLVGTAGTLGVEQSASRRTPQVRLDAGHGLSRYGVGRAERLQQRSQSRFDVAFACGCAQNGTSGIRLDLCKARSHRGSTSAHDPSKAV